MSGENWKEKGNKNGPLLFFPFSMKRERSTIYRRENKVRLVKKGNLGDEKLCSLVFSSCSGGRLARGLLGGRKQKAWRREFIYGRCHQTKVKLSYFRRNHPINSLSGTLFFCALPPANEVSSLKSVFYSGG